MSGVFIMKMMYDPRFRILSENVLNLSSSLISSPSSIQAMSTFDTDFIFAFLSNVLALNPLVNTAISPVLLFLIPFSNLENCLSNTDCLLAVSHLSSTSFKILSLIPSFSSRKTWQRLPLMAAE